MRSIYEFILYSIITILEIPIFNLIFLLLITVGTIGFCINSIIDKTKNNL